MIEYCLNAENLLSKLQDKWGDIGFAAKEGLGIIGYAPSKFFTETDPNVIKKYKSTDGKHYDDAIMRRAVEDVKNSGKFNRYNFINNNCQDFVESVKKRYGELFRQQGVKK